TFLKSSTTVKTRRANPLSTFSGRALMRAGKACATARSSASNASMLPAVTSACGAFASSVPPCSASRIRGGTEAVWRPGTGQHEAQPPPPFHHRAYHLPVPRYHVAGHQVRHLEQRRIGVHGDAGGLPNHPARHARELLVQLTGLALPVPESLLPRAQPVQIGAPGITRCLAALLHTAARTLSAQQHPHSHLHA